MVEVPLETTTGASAKATAAASAAITTHLAASNPHSQYSRRFLTTTPSPFADPVANLAASNLVVVGYDATDNRLFGLDFTASQLKQSSDGGVSWSGSKGLPSNTSFPASPPTSTSGRLTRIVRFGAYIYAVTVDSTSGRYGVYRTLPASGSTAFSWSAQLLTFQAGATTIVWNLSAGDGYIYAGEYGDPLDGSSVPNPQIYRSSDGVTWTVALVAGLSPTGTHYRHIHGVEPDPNNPGHVWATIGDTGQKGIRYSTDHGATWSQVANESGNWQATAIGFSSLYPDYVFLAPDNAARGSSMFIVDKADASGYTPKGATANWHYNVAVPGGASGDRFYKQAYMGITDPATGIHYFISNEPASGGTIFGLFFVLAPGMPCELIEAPISGIPSSWLPQAMVIANGKLFYGTMNRPTLSATAVPPTS